MSALMEAVRAGRTAEVVGLLDGLTDAERRAFLPELKALRKELRNAPWGHPSHHVYPALHAAGAACETGAAAAASWIAASDMRWSQSSAALLIHILGDRDASWLADVTHRLAGRPASAGVSYELMAGLVRLSGCPVPTTETYVQTWVSHTGQLWQLGDTLFERLRKDPHLTELMAALFETNDVAGPMEWSSRESVDGWVDAIARLTVEGALDRKRTVDACVARLLRGGSTLDHRAFLRVLKGLALTREEEREHTADWLALASDAVPTVASHAQGVLGSLALDGELAPRRLAEMSEAVLFRSEKKLVRAQLVLLGKVLARDASAAAEVLPALAFAFGHTDTEVQERALKLVERHLKKVDSPEVRAELAAAADQLVPSLRSRAVETLGAAPVTAAAAVHEEVLPPPPVTARLAPAPESAVELAEEVGALLASNGSNGSNGDVPTFERVLDGLVRHAYQDRDALLEALGPVFARRWWDSPDTESVRADNHFSRKHNGLNGVAESLDLLLATLRNRVHTATLHDAVQHDGSRSRVCGHSPLSRAFEARVWEVAYRIRAEPLPFLLSTPSWSTGLLEPNELVARLDSCRGLGVRVSAADFAQALLRVRRGDRATAVAAAERAAELGTAEGVRLARWLSSGGPVLPTSRRRSAGARVELEFGELLSLQADFPAGFRQLGRPTTVYGERWYCYHWNRDMQQHWLAILPELRELVAVRIVREVSAAAVDDARGAAAVLPLLAESDGVAGEATHLCLAYGLGARHPEDRLAAVDALLVLAARGQLDGARLGTDLGQLVRSGAVKPSRLAESMRTGAATGANTSIWGILRHTLAALLADLDWGVKPAPARGLGDLLAVAAECAERSGAGGELPHLAQTADRTGSSRLVMQARRLRSALVAGVAA
ncbi:DUF6493 family protein [Streptomyces sp. NPDC050549]|uniref:DUF7825 domain-containing protein n=1 Tax=Streptomyces sp. NPDC050549 TaxID=3155406 RepID=UPI00343A6F19